MVKIQLELTKKANYNASVYKAKNNLKTKQDAVNKLLELSKID